jgi:hypothetical protein
VCARLRFLWSPGMHRSVRVGADVVFRQASDWNEDRALVYVSVVLDALRPSTGADGDTGLRSAGCVLTSREAESES